MMLLPRLLPYYTPNYYLQNINISKTKAGGLVGRLLPSCLDRTTGRPGTIDWICTLYSCEEIRAHPRPRSAFHPAEYGGRQGMSWTPPWTVKVVFQHAG